MHTVLTCAECVVVVAVAAAFVKKTDDVDVVKTETASRS